jgi:hypothetical protein
MQKIGIFSYFELTLRLRQHNFNRNNESASDGSENNMAGSLTSARGKPAMRREPLSMLAQSDFIDTLIGRCVMHGGALATEALLVISADDVDTLLHLANRLRRLALFEDRIRALVMAPP